jgi:hypothetical protein
LAKVKTAAIGFTAGWFYRSYIPGYFYMIIYIYIYIHIYLSIQYHAHNIYIILSYVTPPTILNYLTVYIIIILS